MIEAPAIQAQMARVGELWRAFRPRLEQTAGGGEADLAADAVTVRCIQRLDGSLPDTEDEPGNVAVVARSY